MIGRADFLFTIGYDGNTAVVDGNLKRKYGRYTAEQLAAEGMFKQALCSAIYAQAGQGELGKVLEAYNAQAEQKLASVEELKRIFGVFEVPPGVARVLVI